MVTNEPGRMDRRQAVAQLVAERSDALIVTGLGSPSYDVHAAGDDDRNYYLWGAMGGAALVGLGLALAQPTRRVMVITGDGEQLMAYGSARHYRGCQSGEPRCVRARQRALWRNRHADEPHQ